MPQATTHRKRHGHHQKRNRHFLKVYVPYIPLVLIIATGLYIGNFNRPVQTRGTVLAYSTEMSAGGLLSATNSNRAANGAGALTINAKLTAAAQAKANDMAARNYWSHNTPDGNPPWVFITNAGYSYDQAGENLAYGFPTSSQTIKGWMDSPSHRDNMLNKVFTEVGFGFTNASNYNNDGEETIVVAMYGKPYTTSATSPPPSPASPASPPTVKQTTTIATTPSASVQDTVISRTVEVTIVDSQNKPVKGVTVTLHSEPRTAVTNDKGIATFNDVEPGDHVATAVVNGAKREQPLTVTKDSKIVSITLPKPTTGEQTTAQGNVSKTIARQKRVSRLDLLTRGYTPWLMTVLSAIALVGSGYLLGKHSRALHKLIVNGEKYVLSHSLLDVTIISFVWLCFVVSRTAGTIL